MESGVTSGGKKICLSDQGGKGGVVLEVWGSSVIRCVCTMTEERSGVVVGQALEWRWGFW